MHLPIHLSFKKATLASVWLTAGLVEVLNRDPAWAPCSVGSRLEDSFLLSLILPPTHILSLSLVNESFKNIFKNKQKIKKEATGS